jgi:hypothetical protein
MSGRPKKTLLGTVLLLGVLAFAVGGWLIISKVTDPFRTAAPLDISSYTSSAKSLRGNTYKVAGEVLVLLAWSPSGRLISVSIENGQRTIPVLLPKEFNSVNIQKGQKLNFLLVVDDSGVLRAKKLARS